MNLDTRPTVSSGPLLFLSILATTVFLGVAKAVFIPIVLAIVTTCVLAPVVTWLRRVLRLPRPLGAATVLVLMCGLLVAGANSLQPKLMRILDVVPRVTAQFTTALRASAHDHDGTLRKINRAATELERAAALASTHGAAPTAAPPAHVASVEPSLTRYVMMGTANVVAGTGQLFVVLSLVYFMLISGDSFRRALVRAAGPGLARGKWALRTVRAIVGQVQRYLLIQLATSALLGVIIGVVFVVLGLKDAVFWACCGALLHLVPYVGPAVFMVIMAMIAYVQFNAWVPVVTIVATILFGSGIIGMLLVPWLTQRIGQLNAITVFLALLFWGWLWGIWGMLLGIPIVVALNVICERSARLAFISQFLAESTSRRRRPRAGHPGWEAGQWGLSIDARIESSRSKSLPLSRN